MSISIKSNTNGSAELVVNGNTALTFDDKGAVGGALPFSFRNKVINGNFDFWQRATSQTGSGYGSSDRWWHRNVGSTKTTSQQAFALGQTEVPNDPKYFCRTVVSSVAAAANCVHMLHYVEGVKTLSGRRATLTFYAKADAAKPMSVEFFQHFGSGGTPSPTITGISVSKISLTTTWAKYTAIVDFPSIAGKTLGTANNDYIGFSFWFDAGSDHNARTLTLGQQSGTFDIAQVQLEEGSVATAFEDRPIGLELALCQRYYEKSYNIDITPNTNTAAGCENTEGRNETHQVLGSYAFKVPKRGTPSLTVYGRTGGTGVVYDATAAANRGAVINYGGMRGFRVHLNNNAAPVGNDIEFHWTASAEL